ncbi:MAG: penicillin-binding protein 2 [Bacteroidales bacterium]|nr:penicillin-binding protein 2 [Bacteroidales bacterium]
MIVNNYSSRKTVILTIFFITGIIFLIKLFYLQVIDSRYKLSSQNNVLRYVTQYPARGMVYDRNGKLLVYNEAAYDLMVIPGQVKQHDTLEFCSLLGIEIQAFKERLQLARRHSRYRPSVFLDQISKEDYSLIIEKMYRFPGFYFQSRTLRKYPLPIAAHILGDIGEVNPSDIEKNPYYKSGDYIGKSGIEKFFETELRGQKGLKVVMVDVYNREKGSFQDGIFDTLPENGQSLVLGIDRELQAYGELLMKNKTGSIVAIEPVSGEILALVSSPTFDPNLLVGRVRGQHYRMLQEDSIKPLINRAIAGTYPPGSTFKMINALVALQEGAITENSYFSCQGKGSQPIKCTHSHTSPLALKEAIEQSCNPYFWNTFRSILNNPKYNNQKKAFENWNEIMHRFGLGQRFNTDIPFEVSGNIPSRNYFDKVYRNSWNALTVRSLSIGQGEILVTPIQLANLAALIGNRGYYYLPHLLREIEDDTTKQKKLYQRIESGVEGRHFDVVREAMLDVFEGSHGTARRYFLESIRAAGKTGTVQNPHGKDHSMFMAFAPYDRPGIAIAVVVENAGYGSTWAAPIASLMMEKYLTDSISRPMVEKTILEGNLNNN